MSLALLGKKFVLVGAFSVYHFEVKNLITEHGGDVLDYVPREQVPEVLCVVGEKTDEIAMVANKKLRYFEAYGGRIITESVLSNMIKAGIETDERHAEAAQARVSNEDYGSW